MPDLPRSARFAAWGGAVLRGTASPDVALDAILESDTRHVVHGLPDTASAAGSAGSAGSAGTAGSAEEVDGVGVTLALGLLRRTGATGLALALPVPGDVSGLPGPPAFNADALEAGETVLVRGTDTAYALVPAIDARGSSLVEVRWHCIATSAPRSTPGPSLAEADRALKEGLAEATEELLRLDVARWRPEVLDTLAQLRGRTDAAALPPDYPPRAERVLSSARTVEAILALALPDPGAALSAGAIGLRAEVLTRLASVTRHAVVAAVNAPLEPTDP